jgi:hypothetical protein
MWDLFEYHHIETRQGKYDYNHEEKNDYVVAYDVSFQLFTLLNDAFILGKFENSLSVVPTIGHLDLGLCLR